MSVEKVIGTEVLSEYEEIAKMELGSDQHVKTVDAVNGMVDRLNEMAKIENEKKRLELEEKRLQVETAKLDDDNRDRKIKNFITGVTNGLFLGVTIWGYVDSKKFERTDVHTTEAGKSATRKLLSLWDKIK